LMIVPKSYKSWWTENERTTIKKKKSTLIKTVYILQWLKISGAFIILSFVTHQVFKDSE